MTGHGGAHIVAIITVEGQLDTDHDDEYYHRKRHCCYDDYTIVVVVGSMHHRHGLIFFFGRNEVGNHSVPLFWVTSSPSWSIRLSKSMVYGTQSIHYRGY